MDNRHLLENAREKIAGYMVMKRHGETPEAYFERSKAECVKHMNAAVEVVSAMTYAQFVAAAKHRNAILAAEEAAAREVADRIY